MGEKQLVTNLSGAGNRVDVWPYISLAMGFAAAAALIAPELVRHDPEPQMALLSLYICGVLAAVAALVTNIAAASMFERTPAVVRQVAVGACAAAAFYLALKLSLVTLVEFPASLLLSVAVSATVGGLGSLLGARRTW